ncbi:hypothetical protein HaLaN_01241 [Haematococcus lacustris]|uniref:Uncharacterized protein n=1 Tax=Haematococcus lacustris TaxID=44745 RepID=A0A699Y8T8_HAELA|nr:hypothetical protein HaLaN_01241 [Haematococcus lacustris]
MLLAANHACCIKCAPGAQAVASPDPARRSPAAHTPWPRPAARTHPSHSTMRDPPAPAGPATAAPPAARPVNTPAAAGRCRGLSTPGLPQQQAGGWGPGGVPQSLPGQRPRRRHALSSPPPPGPCPQRCTL